MRKIFAPQFIQSGNDRQWLGSCNVTRKSSYATNLKSILRPTQIRVYEQVWSQACLSRFWGAGDQTAFYSLGSGSNSFGSGFMGLVKSLSSDIFCLALPCYFPC